MLSSPLQSKKGIPLAANLTIGLHAAPGQARTNGLNPFRQDTETQQGESRPEQVGEVTGPAATYFPLLGFCLLAAFVAHRLKYSRTGRAWNAMREDEDVAQATGINIVNYKLLAFAMGASVGCVGGAIYATHLQGVVPGGFILLVSITVLAVVVLGGMGSIPGVVVGAFALIGLPEMLREFAEYKLLVYGAVLVAVMLLRPEGLIPDASRRAELEEARGGGGPDGEPLLEVISGDA